MSDPTILVIDDDTELCDLLAELLGQEGFVVEAAFDGNSGLGRATSTEFAMVVLDVMLPGLGGFEVLRRIRQRSDVPVLMLTARGEDVDRIVGLEIGADDYLPKPFNPRELVARVRAIHRRTSTHAQRTAETDEAHAIGDLEISRGARLVRVRGVEVKLTTAEFDLLDTLARSAGNPVSRDELCRVVLGRQSSALDRSIDMHVSNLRRKLGPLPDGGDRIKTVRSTGYILVKVG
ncbi:MAG: response regulator transcription factor [Polyangiaceae bacterium]